MMLRRHVCVVISCALFGLTLSSSAIVQARAHSQKKHHGQKEHAGKSPKEAPQHASAPKEQVEDVEEVEIVEAAPASTDATATAESLPGGEERSVDAAIKTTSATERLTWKITLGHLHAAVVHLPIAWSLLWAITEMAALLLGRTSLVVAGRWLSALTCISFAPAVLSGLQRFSELSAISRDVSTQTAGLLHRNLMYVALFFAFTLTVGRQRLRLDASWPIRWFYVTGVLAVACLVGYSAHLGGIMVYGEAFLPF